MNKPRRSLRRRITPRHVAVALLAATLLVGPVGMSTAAAPTQCQISGEFPDKHCTPGILNPSVTQSTLATTICKSGWTATVRPKTTYTNPLKLRLMRAYGDTDLPSAYELDHFVPLELGGHPSDPGNLWPEPHEPSPGSAQKDKVENYLKRQVCAGSMTLADAQQRISTDWVSVWKQIGSP